MRELARFERTPPHQPRHQDIDREYRLTVNRADPRATDRPQCLDAGHR
jgi:hypothetical protein